MLLLQTAGRQTSTRLSTSVVSLIPFNFIYRRPFPAMESNHSNHSPPAAARVPSLEARVVHKVVLTGGPCAGKTTGQSSLSSFFENLGWKVYRVPEAANLLLSGGVKFSELDADDVFSFQENLLKTMMQIEETYFALAENSRRNVLIICDRGTMDPSAYMDADPWDQIMQQNGFNAVDIRDNRYNQVIHMVTAARGAEQAYTCANSTSRSEGIDLACDLDGKIMKAWIGHPYLELLDNSTSFEGKIKRLVAAVCNRLGIDTGDRLAPNSRKRKFLIRSLPPPSDFPKYEDFLVEHDYLVSNEHEQARLRKRGWNGHWGYLYTMRRIIKHDDKEEIVEQRTQLTERDYMMLLAQRDPHRSRVYKRRRCFLWNNQYFQLDIFSERNPVKCRGLLLLETFTTKIHEEIPLPDFLDLEKEVTFDKQYSMFNLSRKEHADIPPHVPKGKYAKVENGRDSPPHVNGNGHSHPNGLSDRSMSVKSDTGFKHLHHEGHHNHPHPHS